MGGLRHGIGLVEDDELERVRLGTEHVACARKRLDLAADDVDAAVVGRIQLQHMTAIRRAVQTRSEGHDRRRLAGAGRPVEEEVGQLMRVDEPLERRRNVLVRQHLIERRRPVLFHPRQRVTRSRRIAHVASLALVRHGHQRKSDARAPLPRHVPRGSAGCRPNTNATHFGVHGTDRTHAGACD